MGYGERIGNRTDAGALAEVHTGRTDETTGAETARARKSMLFDSAVISRARGIGREARIGRA